MSSYEFCELFENTFFMEHFRLLLLLRYGGNKNKVKGSNKIANLQPNCQRVKSISCQAFSLFFEKFFSFLFERIRSFVDLGMEIGTIHCVKNVRIRSYSGTHFPALYAFSRIWTEYRETLCIFPYSVQMRENVDHNNSECGHVLHSDLLTCKTL